MPRRDRPAPDRHALERQLDEGLSALGLALREERRGSLIDYLLELNRWNTAYNLTAVRDPVQMVNLHLLDCLSLHPWFEGLDAGHRTLDAGTGPGLPGIPLALTFPDHGFTLLDANGKKTRFLTQAVSLLGLDNVEVVKARSEDYRGVEPFDTVTSRAFAALPEIVSLTGHLMAPGGRILAMKGRRPEEELDALPAGWRAEVRRLEVPGVDGERHLVELNKEGDEV